MKVWWLADFMWDIAITEAYYRNMSLFLPLNEWKCCSIFALSYLTEKFLASECDLSVVPLFTFNECSCKSSFLHRTVRHKLHVQLVGCGVDIGRDFIATIFLDKAWRFFVAIPNFQVIVHTVVMGFNLKTEWQDVKCVSNMHCTKMPLCTR